MYSPKYKITTEILKNVGLVEAAREVIDNAPMVPAWETKFRSDATLRAAHFGTALEGNDLTFNEAKLLVEQSVETTAQAEQAGVVARPRDVQEVINYRRVLGYLESYRDETGYSKELLLAIHKIITDKLVDEDKSGKYRETQVVLKNSVTGEISFRPPSHIDVPLLMNGFFDWLNSDSGKSEHPIIRAGVAHYVLAAVHPFVEGNGRTARAFATLVLFREGYDIKRFFALEEYFDSHADEYFGSLMEVSNQSPKLEERDLTPWLTTFTRALSIELTRIKEKIRELSVDVQIKKRQGKQVSLSERQMKMVEYLGTHGEITMKEARSVLTMVSEDTILRDLKDLIDKEVIAKKGSTKAAKYVLKK